MQTYYSFGSLHDPSETDPPFEAASPIVRLRIAHRGYALYDGCPAISGDELGATEGYVSLGISSRVIVNDVVRLLALADEARPLLARIPSDARLEEASDTQLAMAADLIDVLRKA